MTNTQKKPPTPGTEILQEAYKIVNQDRQNTYGHPKDDYTKVTNIYQTLTGHQLTLTDALLFMVSVKLARLKTNLDQGHLHHDTLLDTIGYLTCINMIHQPESTTNENTPKNTKKETNNRTRNQTNRKRNNTTKPRNPKTR
jgi:hypothetical protein